MQLVWVLKRLRDQDRQCTYKRNTEAVQRNHCCCGKAMRIVGCERVCL
jgi:hypothetical protein